MAKNSSSGRLRIAMPATRKVRPAFTVQKLDGEREVVIHSFDANGKRLAKTTKVPAGYMVKFSKGHSIRVSDDAQLQRLGFDQTIPLLNEDGDVVGDVPNDILELNGEE